MAGFQEVIHQTKRICKSVNGNCGKCLLGAFSCPNNTRFDSTDEQKFIEFANAVMSWAAENPEPVYPTWFEWLNSMGLTKHDTGQFCVYMPNQYSYEVKEVDILNEVAYESIPADIAQKLGIQPKEG